MTVGMRGNPAQTEDPDEPLSVTFVAVQFPAGPETFVSARVRSLREAGHDVSVLAFLPPPGNWRELLAERGLTGTPVTHNGALATARGVAAAIVRPRLLGRALKWLFEICRGETGHLLRAIAVLPFAFHAVSRLQTRPPDVVHLEWGHYPSVLVPLLRWTDTPSVTCMSLVHYDLVRGFPGSRTAAHMADIVRTQTTANVEEVASFTGLDPSKIEMVPDGLDARHMDALRSGVEKVPGRVVAVSRLVPHKAIDEAIEAFAVARRSVPHATLHIGGDGPEEARLRSLAAKLGVADHVKFLGHVAHDEVIREIAAAEVLVHLSHHDRLPNSVKEAMACDTLVVTSRTVGIEELVQDGRTGFLVDIGDRDSAAEVLTRVLGQVQELYGVRAAANDLVRRTMVHSASIAKLVGLWRAALARRNGHERAQDRASNHGKVT